MQLQSLMWQVTSLMDRHSLYCLRHVRQHLHPSRSGPPPPLWTHRLQVCKTLPHSKSCCCRHGRRICAWNEEKRTRPGYSLPLSCQSDAVTLAEPALELGTPASVRVCLWRPLKCRTNQLVRHPQCRATWGTPFSSSLNERQSFCGDTEHYWFNPDILLKAGLFWFFCLFVLTFIFFEK